MKVTITDECKKRKYEYKTINLNKTGLKGWEISTRWGQYNPINNVRIDKEGNISIVVRKEIS